MAYSQNYKVYARLVIYHSTPRKLVLLIGQRNLICASRLFWDDGETNLKHCSLQLGRALKYWVQFFFHKPGTVANNTLEFGFKQGLSWSHFLPTFSIFLDSCQFKALWTWLCVIDKNLGTWECLQQIRGQLICIPFVHLSGFTAVVHETRKETHNHVQGCVICRL